MLFADWYSFTPHIALREHVRELEGELSLLADWPDRPEEWREEFRARLAELLGLPRERCDLQVREMDRVECEGYTRLRVVYNVEPGLSAPAWLCVPFANETPLPAVVCAHPEGSGKDEVVGLVGDASCEAYVPYAGQLAQRGYITIAPDARGFGERLDGREGLEVVGRLLGRPLVGMQVWDLMRAVDLLLERADVRPARVGATGLGMGGLHAILTAAADERLNCAAACGGFCTYRELIVARDCFACGGAPRDALPGLLRYADLDDVACLIAPRALMLAHSRGDASVPLRAVEDCMERVKEGFALQAEQVKLETVLVDGEAKYQRDPLYRFLDDWLKLPEV